MTERENDYHAERFVEAMVIGEIADAVFAEECQRRGLRMIDVLRGGPLDWLSGPAYRPGLA